MRYGSIDPATGLSMTELEYRQAVVDKKKLCVFLIADERSDHCQDGRLQCGGVRKLVSLKKEILATRTCGFFRTVEDLTNHASDVFPKLHANRDSVSHGSCLLPEWEVTSINPLVSSEKRPRRICSSNTDCSRPRISAKHHCGC